MTDPLPSEEATLFPKTAGEKLREAREAQGLSLAEIAARTRVPVRQLEAIELGNYATLPSITYSVGFAKAYARAVGIDEVAIAREVRGASDQPNAVRRTEYEAYQIDEPSRVPTRGLAIATLLVAIVLLVGVGVWLAMLLYGIHLSPVHFWAVAWFGLLGTMFLALLGVLTSIWADKFDNAAAVSNFIVTPLGLLSGTFYSVDKLAPAFRAVSHANPFFYIISGFRYGFLGTADSPILIGSIVVLVIDVVLAVACYALLRSGWKIKN